MRCVNFITTNKNKCDILDGHLASYGLKVRQVALSINEIQADDISDIAIAKAMSAYEILKEPVVVNDSGLRINALKGFPGQYTKYVQNVLGSGSVLKLLDSLNDRTCYFETVLVYVNEAGKISIFEDKVHGTIAQVISKLANTKAWGDLWRIFIPDGYNKTLSEMLDDEYAKYVTARDNSIWKRFAIYINDEQRAVL